MARPIRRLRPETIIVLSPHLTMYADYFHISPGDGADGVDTVAEQIAIAKKKAGIGENEPVIIERFEVIRHF